MPDRTCTVGDTDDDHRDDGSWFCEDCRTWTRIIEDCDEEECGADPCFTCEC